MSASDDLEYHINFPTADTYEEEASVKHSTDNSSNRLDTGQPSGIGSIAPEANSNDPGASSKSLTFSELRSHDLEFKGAKLRSQLLSCDSSQIKEDLYQRGREPVIFLLGWLNAQDRHIAKYSTMYNGLGFITVRYTSPPLDLFRIGHKNLRVVATRLMNLLDETTLSSHPVIFHNFSNNGSVLYSYISELYFKKKTNLNIVGCIFDSAPSPIQVKTGINAVYNSVPGPCMWKLVVSLIVGVGLGLGKLYDRFRTFLYGSEYVMTPWCLINERPHWPQLFLYSKKDRLIPFKYVEKFSSKRREMGVDVTVREFFGSPHVMHFRHHPIEYRETVYHFIQSCLKSVST